MKLTKRQREILDFLVEFIATYEYAPSFREIAEHFNLGSTATVHEHIRNLENAGYLQAVKGEARSLSPSSKFIRFKRAIELPLVGLIAAGEPIEAIEENETICVPLGLVDNKPNSFVLQVKGDSMIEDGILNGDYIIAERHFSPKNGDVVVALLNNQYATLKKFFREKNRIRLQPANRALKPIYVQNPAIQGIVRAVMRKYI
ncbi:MAG: transcriptional repressor LexA [bacterium]|nr:transcriptional repressor LexA [bacterium]